MNALLTVLIRLVIAIVVVYALWYVGLMVIAEMALPAIAASIWKIMIGLIGLLALIRASAPVLGGF